MTDYTKKTKAECIEELKKAHRRIAALEKRLQSAQDSDATPQFTIPTKSEGRFQKLMEDMDMVAVQGYDAQRRVIYWNTASERLYGFSKEEAYGKHLEDLIIPDFMREGVVQGIADWIENDVRIPAGELDLLHKDGSSVPVYSSHVMQSNAKGEKEMYCIDVYLGDIKKAHSMLLQAKNEAEAANRVKSEFLANMSHEIRTPLNGLLGMIQLLKTNLISKEHMDYAEMALQAGKRLTSLLSDILDIARIESGRMHVQKAPFELPEVINQVIELFMPESRQKNIQLNFSYGEDIPRYVNGDSLRLQQVLSNLVGNAIKFTSQGQVLMEVKNISSPLSEKQWIMFSVTDTGDGIPEDQAASLFEPFTQGVEGYQRKHQGAGLGLSICKRLVELMGGSISLESTYGSGTTVVFTLPLRPVPAPEKLCAQAMENGIQGRQLNILLAEDDSISGYSAKRLLEIEGYEVTLVQDGQAVLLKLQESSFDVVLMDIQMPVMDGVEATKLIRRGDAGEKNKPVPIVAMTSYAMADDKETFLQAGMDEYIAKPLTRHDLCQVLTKVIAKIDTV